MARAATISALTDDLISVLSRTSDKNSNEFRKSKARYGTAFRDNAAWGRTDQFAIAKQLDGLQEKFRILNNDELANALNVRLLELDQQKISWAPEILSLLLQLSDRPANVSKLPTFNLLKPADGPSQLTWSEIDPAGTAYSHEDIWNEPDFGAESSDDDYSTVSSDISIPRIVPQSTKPSRDEFAVANDIFSSGENEELLSTIRSGHFWEYDSTAVHEFSESHTRFVTVLQAVREILFMLQGLPTSLFWHLDDSIAVDRRYALRHSSNAAFLHLLRHCASIGSRLGDLRRFTKAPQSVVFLQTFVREIEKMLRDFDVSLSGMQLRYLSAGRVVTISLMQLMKDIEKECRVLLSLADLVVQLGAAQSDHSFVCLDLLYDLVCANQAAGNDQDFKALAQVFFSCFEAYTRPIRLWMETGHLDAAQGTFFISDTRRSSDLRTLWHDWYSLEETGGRLHAPKFLKPAAQKAFTTGKSMVFLRHLNIVPEIMDSVQKSSLSFEDICPEDEALRLLPFSGLLDKAFAEIIAVNHDLASNLLRQQLDEQCGLWTSVSALEYIYLCRDLTVSSTVDSKIFELIDRGLGVWNDRFLLTELVQSTFSEVPSVDSSRLIVRSSPGSYRDAENRNRTVKVFKSLSIDYVLPWPVANIITKSSINTYQRISTFLMQIRRAKYIVERQRLRKEGSYQLDSLGVEAGDEGSGYIIRHRLLWFTNILYSHMTEFVIAMCTASMEKSMAVSRDVDGMIAAHKAYMSSLEEQCLLSTNLATIHQAVISILDLCVHFADVQATLHGRNQFDKSTRSWGSSTGRRPPQSLKRAQNRPRAGNPSISDSEDDVDHVSKRDESNDTDDEGDYDDDDDDDDDNEFYDEGNTTSISFHESPYSHRLRHIREQFDRLLAFVVAGLRGVGRIDGQQSWEILSERLEWAQSASSRF